MGLEYMYECMVRIGWWFSRLDVWLCLALSKCVLLRKEMMGIMWWLHTGCYELMNGVLWIRHRVLWARAVQKLCSMPLERDLKQQGNHLVSH